MLELATGRVCGYEALARIDGEPVRRPDQWFAQAHRAGLGAELEALALRAALAVAGRPAGTFLALNVSPGALLAPPVADALPDDLSGYVIELTEHELFTAEGALEACLAELRARGARVALDDAGAGYAGLQQLIRVAPDILKIDRSLVHGAHSDASATRCWRRSSRSPPAPAPPSAARASRTSTTCARSPTSTPRTRRATRSRGRPTPGPR